MSRAILKIIAPMILFSMRADSLGQTEAPRPKRISEVSQHFSFLGFTLGKSTLADVQTKLGHSEILKCSQEEEAGEEVCYVSPGDDQTKVVFESGFSGGWTELDGFKLISGKLKPRCYRECTRTPLVHGNLCTVGGLKLGLTERQLKELLGSPKRTRGNKLTFRWQSRLPMSKEQIEKGQQTSLPMKDAFWDVVDTVEVTLMDSKAVEFHVKHIVTD